MQKKRKLLSPIWFMSRYISYIIVIFLRLPRQGMMFGRSLGTKGDSPSKLAWTVAPAIPYIQYPLILFRCHSSRLQNCQQMVPMYLNIGFPGFGDLIQGQIYNPAVEVSMYSYYARFIQPNGEPYVTPFALPFKERLCSSMSRQCLLWSV